jgi:tetratricopeptide (TPR) repeat protein
MRGNPLHLRARVLVTVAAILWSAAAGIAHAGGGAVASVLIAPSSVDPNLGTISQGFEAWLRLRFDSLGIATISRAELSAHSPSSRADALPPEQVAAVATRLGAAYVVFPDLRLTSGQVEVRLRLVDPSTRRLLLGARATASLGEVGEACEATAARILAALGAGEQPGLPPRPDELASSGRALVLAERGELFAAWKEVEHKLSPTAVATREGIVESALEPGPGFSSSASARARVLAAAGHAGSAWTLIEDSVRREVLKPKPDPLVLLAAAEVELSRSNPREARNHVELLVRAGFGSADVYRTHARILLEQNDRLQARDMLRMAVKLDPSDPESLEQLAELESADRQRRAELLVLAGRSEALRLDTHRAERLFNRAEKTEASVAVDAWRGRGELQGNLGRPAESLTAFRKAVDLGGNDADTHRGIGDAQHLLGQQDAAEQSYQRALSIAPQDSGSLHGLGVVHLAKKEPAKAVPLLRRSLDAAPDNAVRRRNLAQALRATGDLDGALKILKLAPAGGDHGKAESLQMVAEIHQQRGDHEAARDNLLEATRLDPFDPDIQEQLAVAYEATGDAASAARARELTTLLRGETPTSLERAAQLAGEVEQMRMGPSLDGIVASFATSGRGASDRAVTFLGIRNPDRWREHLYTWLYPRRPDDVAITNSLETALARSFSLARMPETDNPLLLDRVDRLYAFEEQMALDADNIAAINQSLGVHGVFVARLTRAPGVSEEAPEGSACADPDRFEIEVRMLNGQIADVVDILANQQCIAAGFRDHGVWNERALATYGVLFLILIFPILRGWGKVSVIIKLPPKTKGFFAIRVAKNADDLPAERSKKLADGRLKRSLKSLSRFERHMVGRETVFRWIPARKRSYHVTVKGPLMDARGEEIIGHFLETQKTRVLRGKTMSLEYDFRPVECGVEIRIQFDGTPATGARLALGGEPASLRYARNGTTIIPLPKGTHRLLVGANDRVAEYDVCIETLGRSIQIVAELNDENVLAFKDCPAAVEPYLIGDFQTAAEALEAAGSDHAAHVVRAQYHRQVGSTGAAADELEAAGFLEAAAEMRATDEDAEGSARLFEKAGDYDRAGEAYQAAGDLSAAARCYEAAYDYDNALECYREAGNDAKALEILEKTGAFFDAGRLAIDMGDPDRALIDLQQVETRDANYGDACKLVADILEKRGDVDIAADKIAEALRCAGSKATAELHERYADLLARSGRTRQAIDAYQTVRRIDPQRRDLGQRIADLERQGSPERKPPEAGAEAESRYEILGELGRGAMGVVFKARDKNLGRVVALKRLPDNLRDHPTAVALFRREAQAAAALNHRNIVTLFDAGEENGSYFITMELLEGMPLNQILKQRGRLQVSDTARIGIQISAGLQYAKENRIVHRDIKTGNLFFTKDRTVKIMDFGLAKTIEEVRKTSTMIGGTPYFMAPEQAIGDELDHRADLYAFGVTLYQLLTGTVPFREGDLAYHHRHTPPPDPRTHVPEIPAAMAELILRMLAKLPGDRPSDASEVAAELQKILNEAGGPK